MNSIPNQPNHDSKQAAALDILIARRLNGQPTPLPKDLPAAKAELAIYLIDQATEILPDEGFAASLEAELLQRQALAVAQANSAPGIERPIAQPASSPLETLRSLTQRRKPRKLPSSARLFSQVSLAALAFLVAVSLVMASTPSLRLLALEFVQVFQRTRSDQVGSENGSNAEQAEPLSEEAIQEAERQYRATATVEEMENERGFDLKEPAYIPAGFELQQIGSPYSEVVFIVYKNHQTEDRVFVTQQRLSGSDPVVGPIVLIPSAPEPEDYSFSIMWSNQPLFDDDPALAGGSPIGASAKTTPIQVNEVIGEYVEGTWQELVSPDGVMQGMEWVQDPSFRQVQWREGDILFQVFSPNAMSQEELAAVARSLR